MFRLLSIEYQKLRHSRSARVLIIIYFILLLSIALTASIEIPVINYRLADAGIFNFPFIWHFNSWVAALLKIFLAIVIVSMMSNEYSNRTLKQNLIDGLSKKEFVLSKFYMVLVFSIISTVFLFLVSLVLGLLFSDYTEVSIIMRDLDYLLAYFFKLVGFFAFCMFLGVLVKRSAFALGFLFVWWIFENLIVYLPLQLYFKNSEVAERVTQFLPLESMSNLIKEPFTKFNAVKSAANQLGQELVKDYAIHWYQIAIVSLWIFLFVYLTLLLLRKRDL